MSQDIIKRSNYIDKCLFSYISNAIFLIGITFYLYFFLVDLKERVKINTNDSNNNTEEPYMRPRYKTMWIYGFFILLLIGFFISSYMCKANS